jgi:predicted DNA binding protein
MPHLEVEFKLQHDCPMTRLTKKYPSAVIARWCQYESDFVEATYKDIDDRDAFEKDLLRAVEIATGRQPRMRSTKLGLQLVANCNHQDMKTSMSRFFVRHGCLEIYPAIYTGGWEWYRLVALSGSKIRRFFEDLGGSCNVEIISKSRVETRSLVDTFTMSTSSLFGSLTEKQARALRTALEAGYYQIPKRTSTKALAESFGVNRTTFEEHLRIAEGKVLRSLAPSLRLASEVYPPKHP